MEPQALTEKELGFVEDCLKAEVLCATKLGTYEREAREPELREMCRHGIQTCERHITELLSLLR